MKSPEMGMVSPKQKTPERKKSNQPTVKVKYTEPSYYSDGDGSIKITIGNKTETIELYSQYFRKETIDKIKTLLKEASNEEDREKIIDTIRTSVARTKGGGHVKV